LQDLQRGAAAIASAACAAQVKSLNRLDSPPGMGPASGSLPGHGIADGGLVLPFN